MHDLNGLTRPTVPPGAIQQCILAETEERRGVVGPTPVLPDNAGAPTTLRAVLRQAVAELTLQIVGLSHDIHDHPETGYKEHHAMATAAELLYRHGIKPEAGIYGMDTALRAEIPGGDGADAVAGGSYELAGIVTILTGCDALPDTGHGCGHNVMCANPVDAFLALAALARTRPGSPPGRVVLQTTPTEENSTTKEILAMRGMLDGADAAIQTHSYAHDVTHQTRLGVRRLCIIFHGVSAHAASQPSVGRNALDIATLALIGIGLLCQQMFPTNRLRTIITGGGQVPNIIPKRTELSIMVRSKYLEALKEIAERVKEILHGATLMTGTGAEILTSEYHNEIPVRDDGPLLTSWMRSQRERGRDPLAAGVLPEAIAIGTDFGNVSQRIPNIRPLIKVADRPDVALRTSAMAEAAGASAGDTAVLDGTYGLAAVALGWLYDAELRRAVCVDFEATDGTIGVANFWEE